MTEEQFKLLQKTIDDFIKETRDNFGQLFKDRQYDFDHFDKQLKDIYLVLGQARHEAHVLTDTANTAIDKVEESGKQVVEKIEEVQKQIEEIPVTEDDKNLTKGSIISKLLGRKQKNAKLIKI